MRVSISNMTSHLGLNNSIVGQIDVQPLMLLFGSFKSWYIDEMHQAPAAVARGSNTAPPLQAS